MQVIGRACLLSAPGSRIAELLPSASKAAKTVTTLESAKENE
jgi:hypothetical protein